jgi:DNA polymerase I-like protein with 3'-5' exonuclease and polymerase domains
MEWVSSGFSRDILAEKMLEIDREIPGGQIVLTVHDEIILEHPKKNHKQAFKKFTEIMHRVPEWAPGFPLKSACEIRSRFGK